MQSTLQKEGEHAPYPEHKTVLGGKHGPAGHTPAAPVSNTTNTMALLRRMAFDILAKRAEEGAEAAGGGGYDSIGMIFRYVPLLFTIDILG